MDNTLIIAIVIFFVIALVLIFYVRKQENTAKAVSAFIEEGSKNKKLFVYSDSEILLKRLYDSGWRVNLCASCDITRDSREQAKILYGDRIFNASFYESAPLVVKDEDIKSVRWFNDNAVIDQILTYDELNMLANTNKVNLRNALVEKGWRFHYSKLCDKCVDQLFFIYDKGEKFDNLLVLEYQENHNHGWNNIYTKKTYAGVLDTLTLYSLLQNPEDSFSEDRNIANAST